MKGASVAWPYEREVAVFFCVVGLTLAQNNNFFPGAFSWNKVDTAAGNAGTNPSGKDVVPNPGNAGGVSDNVPPCEADQESCGCCLMHQQISRMKENFNFSLNALKEELNKAVATLEQFRSTRSAFSVSLFSDSTISQHGPFRDDDIIKYKHVFLNMGNNYNPNTGVFTVPRTGVYNLALTVYSDSGAPGNTLAVCASLQVNGQELTGPRDVNLQDQEDSASVSLVVKLNTGDKVSVNLPIGCFLWDDINHYNTFSGFLLYTLD
ncbi:hypothetical protein WMY93_029011 [Mugilogobius chulae]|uniref:C1q domain-containing protein n=1 Tax=Mugilogobius chulae TaxID=88201 RepID=A0AAW0MUM5_9GOBI